MKERKVITNRQVAVKILNTQAMKPSDLAAAKREIEILSKIGHKNIVKLLDVMECTNKLYIVLEFAGIILCKIDFKISRP